jgi:hypothetical protein
VSSRPMSPCSSKIPIENKENELWRDVNPRKSGVLFRQSRTLIWLVLLASSCAYGQCTLWNQSTCSSLYSFNANPSLATFLADVEASFQAIDAAVSAMPQPKIVVTAQILPASGAWISTAPQMFGPAINGYMDLLKTSAGVFVGAAATGISYPPSLDTPYWDDWANGSTTPASLDFLVIDYFGGSCVQSGNYYYSEAVWYAANFLSRAANIHGKPVRIGQSDHPVWCPAGGSSEQRYAYLGAGDVIWQTSGMQTTWQSTMIRWASAAGLQSFAMYCTLPLFNYTANQSQDNCSTGAYSGLAMSQLSPTDAAAAYKSSAQWPTESIQGNTHLAGRASLGH